MCVGRLSNCIKFCLLKRKTKAVEALGYQLQPASSKALLSAQLMKRKQQISESADAYSKDFESLFEKDLVKEQGWIKLPNNY